MKQIGIGLLGYGSIGKIHTFSYSQLPLLYPGKLPEIVLEGICTSNSSTADRAVKEGSFRQGFTDIAELLQQDGVNVVDCCLPNFLHRQALLQAFAAGKHVYCEKPLALNAEETRQIVAVARKLGVQVGMTFNFRFVPALMRAKELIDEGLLGKVYSFRAEYFHTGYQNPDRPMSWRMRKELSGGSSTLVPTSLTSPATCSASSPRFAEWCTRTSTDGLPAKGPRTNSGLPWTTRPGWRCACKAAESARSRSPVSPRELSMTSTSRSTGKKRP